MRGDWDPVSAFCGVMDGAFGGVDAFAFTEHKRLRYHGVHTQF
jgi:hypothetical protein